MVKLLYRYKSKREDARNVWRKEGRDYFKPRHRNRSKIFLIRWVDNDMNINYQTPEAA
jgi:hypothetical protein